MKRSIYIIFFLLTLTYACGGKKKILTPEEYRSWVKNSQDDLVKVKEVNGYRFTTKLKPTELLLIQNPELLTSQASVDSMINIQKGVVNIVMDIGSVDNNQSLLRANLRNEDEYYQRVYYYTKEVQNDLYLVEGTDTLPCAFYHFEQTYNLSPVNSLIMEFQRRSPDATFKDISLIYEDRILNTGIMKFQFKQSFLNNLPQLKLL